MFGVHSSIRRLSQSSSDEEGPPPASSGAARVKRALFGPTDHEENLRFVKNELKKARSEASSRWNFDFDSGRPLSGQYDWEEVESSTASRTICNPEKHELLAPGPAEKENRVTSCDSVEAGAGETDQPRPDARSRVSVEAAGRLTSDSLDTSDSPGTPSTPPGPSAASAASTASSILSSSPLTLLTSVTSCLRLTWTLSSTRSIPANDKSFHLLNLADSIWFHDPFL